MKRRVFAAMIAVCMVFSLGAINALANDAAYSEWTGETSLPTSGTYKLMNNVTLESEVTVSKTLVLDLNGKTITTNDGQAFFVTSAGSLTIEDSDGAGKIVNTDSGSSYLVQINGGEFYMSDGCIENVNSNGTALFLNSSSKAKMSGGTIVSTGNNSHCVFLNGTSSFEMTGGTVKYGSTYSSKAAIYANNSADSIKISGGNIESNTIGVYAAFTSVEVTGGTFDTESYAFQTRNLNVDPAEGSAVVVTSETGVLYNFSGSNNKIAGGEFTAPVISKDYTTESDTPSVVEITGGSFSGLETVKANDNNTVVTISNGTFTDSEGNGCEDVINYLPKDQAMTVDPDTGEIVVDKKNAAAEVNGVGYPSLQAAINAASAGDVVTVYAGTHEGNITIDKSITLEGANKGVSGTGTRAEESVITGVVTLGNKNTGLMDVVFDGLKFTGSGSIVATNGMPGGVNLTVTNCVADGLTNTFVTTRNNDVRNGTITVTNNKVTNITGASNSAFNLWNAAEHVITDNYVENVPYNAFNLDRTTGNVTFERNTIKNVGEYGLQLANEVKGDSVIITGNTFEGVGDGKSAVYIFSDTGSAAEVSADISVSGNTVAGENVDKAFDFSNADVSGRVSGANNTLNGEPVSVTFAEGEDSVFNYSIVDKDGKVLAAGSGPAGTVVALPDYEDTFYYRFAGWRSSVDRKVYNGSYTLSANVTLTAVWSRINVPDPNEISVNSPANGSVNVSLSNASAGAEITITVTPDAGYVVGSVTVTGPNGAVAVTRVSATEYRFTMPDGAVSVNVSFVSAAFRFTDVPAGAWYYDAVNYVCANGMMEGTSATTFEPDAKMTRAMVWTILARIDGETVTGSAWQQVARAWAMSEGVSDGTDANGFITREQLVTMLWRYAGEPESSAGLSGYADAGKVSSWAEEAMAWAIEKGIISGVTANTLDPQGHATRAQAAAILMRFAQL